MDGITVLGLVLALLGIGLTLVFVVWQPSRPLARKAIGAIGMLLILAAIVILFGFAPIRWQSPIVLRSPVTQQSATASESAATPVATFSPVSPHVETRGRADENRLKTKLTAANEQLANLKSKLRSTSDSLAQCENERQACAEYRQKVANDLGYLLDRDYIGEILAAKGEIDADKIEVEKAMYEFNHAWNQNAAEPKLDAAELKEGAARDRLNKLRRTLIEKLSALAGRTPPN
jgi:hypothetical protein